MNDKVAIYHMPAHIRCSAPESIMTVDVGTANARTMRRCYREISKASGPVYARWYIIGWLSGPDAVWTTRTFTGRVTR